MREIVTRGSGHPVVDARDSQGPEDYEQVVNYNMTLQSAEEFPGLAAMAQADPDGNYPIPYQRRMILTPKWMWGAENG